MIDYEPRSWLRIVLSLRGSVAPRLAVRVAVAGALGLAALWARRDAGFSIPALAHTLIGVALGLLLVFRTNASYSRYVEARELLGRLVNASRDLARQVATYVEPHGSRAQAQADVVRWIGAFYRLLVQNVRDETNLDDLGERLTPGERRDLESVKARSAVVATWISRRLVALHSAGHLDEQRLRAMDGNLGGMIAVLGGCERIRRTPVPFAYAQHIKVFVVLFCYTVPFALAETLHEYTPMAAAILAFALFGIDEIGVEIEDPFGHDDNDLPMDRIGDVLEASTREIAAAGDGPAAAEVRASA